MTVTTVACSNPCGIGRHAAIPLKSPTLWLGPYAPAMRIIGSNIDISTVSYLLRPRAYPSVLNIAISVSVTMKTLWFV